MARYFRQIEPDPAIARSYVLLQDTIANLTARGRVVDARRYLAAYIKMRERYERLGIEGAAESEEFVRLRLESSRSGRPDATGRLQAAIQSRPLVSGLPAGAIGIGDLGTLNRATTRSSRGRKYKPYWRAQEYGYSGNVGRIVPGYFQPGDSPPSQDEYRAHPYFTRVHYTKGEGETPPAMVIGEPIEARHFLSNGVRDTLKWYTREAEKIQSQVIADITPRPRAR